jgi:hypothetical protein
LNYSHDPAIPETSGQVYSCKIQKMRLYCWAAEEEKVLELAG